MQKLNTNQTKQTIKIQQNKTTLVLSPLMTRGQEMRWAYSTMITHMGPKTHTGLSFQHFPWKNLRQDLNQHGVTRQKYMPGGQCFGGNKIRTFQGLSSTLTTFFKTYSNSIEVFSIWHSITDVYYVAYTLWTTKKGHPFYFCNNLIKCWPNFTVFGRNVAEKICNIRMLCCSPHLFSVVTLPQENKVPFNYACTCESQSVPLTAVIMLMIKTYRLNKTIQIHIAYVSVITCVRIVRLRQIHNSEGWSSDWL